MRILFVAPGNSLHTVRWIDQLRGAGEEILLFNSSSSILETIDKSLLYTPLVCVFDKSRYQKVLDIFGLGLITTTLLKRKQIQEAIKIFKPDIVHVHWLLTPSALGCAFINFENIVITPWGSDVIRSINTQNWNFLKKVIWKTSILLISRNAKGICTDGENTLRALAKYNSPARYLEIIRFGVDTDKFTPVERDDQFYFSTGADADSKIVISNRALSLLYDVGTLLDAASQVLTIHGKVIFAIFGDGQQRVKLEAKAKKLGISSNVIFYGQVEQRILTTAIASSDLYVSTSTSDGGIAQSISEAMACAIPVLITDISENAKWMSQSMAGETFLVGDSAVLARLIIRYLTNDGLSKEAGVRGRQFVLKENNSKNQVARMIAFYRRVAK